VQQTPDPEVRMDKVAKIREAVLSGKYKVPASKVAAKILDDMRRK
jgi:flagellar biosynthesis anti-sigma factor FlgM